MEMTAEEARRLFEYNPETGELFWRVQRTPQSRMRPGSVAGTARSNGCGKHYRIVEVMGIQYRAQYLIWLIVTGKLPDEQIDHIDGDGMNNAWVNLRDVTRYENRLNLRRMSSNTSGATGVFWDEPRECFVAYIYKHRKKYHLGSFTSFEEALAVRKAAEVELGFHPNHGTDRPL